MGQSNSGVRPARITLASVACAALLAACTGGAEPAPSTGSVTTTATSATTSAASPTPSASDSETSSGTAYVPVKPAFPAAAKKQTAASAEAFVAYFFELANFAYAKPEAGLIGPLGTLDCKPCQYYEREATALAHDDRHYQSSVLTVKSTSISTTDLDKPWVTLSGRQNKVPIVEPDGRLTAASPASPVTFRVLLKWTDVGWRVQNVVDV